MLIPRSDIHGCVHLAVLLTSLLDCLSTSCIVRRRCSPTRGLSQVSVIVHMWSTVPCDSSEDEDLINHTRWSIAFDSSRCRDCYAIDDIIDMKIVYWSESV